MNIKHQLEGEEEEIITACLRRLLDHPTNKAFPHGDVDQTTPHAEEIFQEPVGTQWLTAHQAREIPRKHMQNRPGD